MFRFLLFILFFGAANIVDAACQQNACCYQGQCSGNQYCKDQPAVAALCTCSTDTCIPGGPYGEICTSGTQSIRNNGYCADKLEVLATCPYELVTGGLDQACKSNKCLVLKVGTPYRTEYCAPPGGSTQGMKCTEDSDCATAGSGHWCKGGGILEAIGICTECPGKCSGGCKACDNDQALMKCGRATDGDKIICGAQVIASLVGDLLGPLFDCLFPGAECLTDTLQTAIDTCSNKETCKIAFGPSCIRLDFVQEFDMDLGSGVTLSGSVESAGSLSVSVNPFTFKTEVTPSVTVTTSAKIQASYSGSKTIKKNIKLVQNGGIKRNPTIYRKLVLIPIPNAPFPILIEVDLEPYFWGTVTMEGELNSNAVIFTSVATMGGTLTVNPKTGSISENLQFTEPSNNIEMTDGSSTGSIVIDARIGPRISIKVQKVRMFNFDAAAHLNVNAQAQASTSGCFSGTAEVGVSLDVRTSVGVQLNPITAIVSVCEDAVDIALAGGGFPVGLTGCLKEQFGFAPSLEAFSPLVRKVCDILKIGLDNTFGAAGGINLIKANTWTPIFTAKVADLSVGGGSCDGTTATVTTKDPPQSTETDPVTPDEAPQAKGPDNNNNNNNNNNINNDTSGASRMNSNFWMAITGAAAVCSIGI